MQSEVVSEFAYLNDPAIWVAVAFILCVWLIGRPAAKMLTSALDNRSHRIREELEEALELREEAQSLLSQYQRQHRDAEKEAEAMVEQAKKDSQAMLAQAKKDLEAALNQRIELAMSKIQQLEERAMEDVQSRAVDMAIGASRALIEKQLTDSLAETLLDGSLDEIRKKAH